MFTKEVDDFLIDLLEHGTSILTASIQRNVHGEVVDEDHHGHQAVVTIMTGELFVFLVAVNVGKLFKTPISERWGKQICLNE